MTQKMVNGELIDLTPEEEQELIDRNAAWEAGALDRLKIEYAAELTAYINETAKTRNYGDAVSFATYVNSSNITWKTEAETFVAWRDAVWIYAYAQLALFEQGQRQAVDWNTFQTELPAIVWP